MSALLQEAGFPFCAGRGKGLRPGQRGTPGSRQRLLVAFIATSEHSIK